MNHYANALEQEKAALSLIDAGFYRQSVYLSCIAMELYLKSRLQMVPHSEELERSHDIVGMLNALMAVFTPKNKNLRRTISLSRKYFNESRYPYATDVSAYTEAFAKEFAGYVSDVRDYIENECIDNSSTSERLDTPTKQRIRQGIEKLPEDEPLQDEIAAHAAAVDEYRRGEVVSHEDINWN